MPRKTTHEDFIKHIKNIHKNNITILDKYTGTNNKIKVKCNKCKNIWETTPKILLRGHSCPKCANDKKKNEKIKPIKQLVSEINKKFSGSIQIDESSYNGTNKNAKFRCKTCGYEWTTFPSNVIRYSSNKCPKCSVKDKHQNVLKSRADVIKDISNIYGDSIKLIGGYYGTNVKTTFKCNKCKNLFESTPKLVLSGHSCPNKCELYERFSERHKNKILELQGDNWKFNINSINNLKDDIELTCKKCGNKVINSVYNLRLHTQNCNNCNSTGSGTEHEIFGYINSIIERVNSMKKINNDEFVKKLKDKWGDKFTALEPYVKRDTPILVRHNDCGYTWRVQPGNLLSNKGKCPNCAGNTKLTKDSVNEKLKEYNLEIIDEYYGMNSKSKFRCKTCGNIINTSLSGILYQSVSCNICNPKKLVKDIEIVNREIKIVSNDEIEMIGEYKGVSQKSKFRCKTCGYEWETLVSSVLSGHGCPKCSKIKSGIQNRISKEEFIERMRSISGDKYSIVSEYTKYSDEIEIKCNECGYIFKTTPVRFISTGCKCNGCYRKSLNFKYDEFVKELETDWIFDPSNSNTLLDDIEFTCKKCGNKVYKSLYYALRQGISCRNCNPTGSLLEDEIYKDMPTEFKIYRNRMFTAKGYKKELDFYIPQLKIGIEFDGLYWHSTNGDRNKQLEKMKFFKDNFGIRVIFIREDEWIEKKDIVIGRLRNILKDPSIKKVPARKLIVKEVSNNIKNQFLNMYHIQGSDNSSIKMGLWTKNGQLAAIMTFGKTRRSMSGNFDSENNVYELIRYSARIGYNIQGGFSKLLKHSIEKLKELNCEYIKTFADLRWSAGNVYETNGFKLDHISTPNYVYCKNRKTYSRIQFQKHKLKDLLQDYDPNKSEKENMLCNGYTIYWDCGNLVYYMKI